MMDYNELAEISLNNLEADNGYSAEKRIGHWMVYGPNAGEGDEPIMIFPHEGYGHQAVDYLPQVKSFIEAHAKQSAAGTESN